MPRNASKEAAKRPRKKKMALPKSRGLPAARLTTASPTVAVERLVEAIEGDGGSVVGAYRDPLGSNWQVLAGLPIDRVRPTPFQRDVSTAHADRLADAIGRLDRFLDPLIAVRTLDGMYWVPNGAHRLAAMNQLGAKAVVALVVPGQDVAYRILALNTEKAHNLRERALEVVRMAQGLAELDDRPEREFATEFEDPALLTLGFCYEMRGRFSGGVYHSVVKRVETFSGARLSKALLTRRERAARLLDLDEQVNTAVNELRDRGFKSPYLKAFVVARINPLRFKRGAKAEFNETVEKMLGALRRFDPGKVRVEQLAGAGGPPED